MVQVCNTDSMNQRDRCVLTIDGKSTVLFIKLRWHSKIKKWMMSMFDETNAPLLRNIPLVSSRNYPSADLLHQFAYIAVGHAAVLPTLNSPSTENPSWNNMGVGKEWALVWGLPDE